VIEGKKFKIRYSLAETNYPYSLWFHCHTTWIRLRPSHPVQWQTQVRGHVWESTKRYMHMHPRGKMRSTWRRINLSCYWTSPTTSKSSQTAFFRNILLTFTLPKFALFDSLFYSARWPDAFERHSPVALSSWAKVRVKSASQDLEGPEGLVPAAYIEKVRPMTTAPCP